jgi:hypothetical protein
VDQEDIIAHHLLGTSVCVQKSIQQQAVIMRHGLAVLMTTIIAALADDLVTLKQGCVKGHRLTSRKGREIFAFQGIPYAKPPVGELRFKVCSQVLRIFPRSVQADNLLFRKIGHSHCLTHSDFFV